MEIINNRKSVTAIIINHKSVRHEFCGMHSRQNAFTVCTIGKLKTFPQTQLLELINF